MTLTEGDLTPPRPALTGSRVRELAGSRLAAPATALLLVAASTAMVELVTPTVPYDAGGVIYLVGVLGVSSVYGPRRSRRACTWRSEHAAGLSRPGHARVPADTTVPGTSLSGDRHGEVTPA
jgi:hypothetical protein